MIANAYLEEAARELLEKEIIASSASDMTPTGPAREFCQESGLFWLLPELVGMVEETRGQPVAYLEPMIHRRLLEQNFVDENGDSLMEASLRAEVDARVRQLLRVLERVSDLAQTNGLWSATAAAPIMFG